MIGKLYLYRGVRGGYAKRTVLLSTPSLDYPMIFFNMIFESLLLWRLSGGYALISLASHIPPALPHIEQEPKTGVLGDE